MDLLRISQNVRALRIAQGMTVDQLAAKSGFSKGFISQVENFRITPSLKAVNKIASALGIELTVLFQTDARIPEYTFGNIGSGEEVIRDNGGHFGIVYRALAYRQIDRLMDPFIIEYHRAAEERDFMLHDTEEFFILLEGELNYFLCDNDTHRLMHPNDTIYLKANVPHRAETAPGCTEAKALIVYSEVEGSTNG